MDVIVLEPVSFAPKPSRGVSLLVRLIVAMLLVQLMLVAVFSVRFVHHHFFRRECDLQRKYGEHTWALVTGCSSGQGKRFVLELAERGFHIILVGRPTVQLVADKVKAKYPHIKTKCVFVDFIHAFEDNFFEPIEKVFAEVEEAKQEVSIVVNNVAHRVAWKPYHEMPAHLIRDCIAVGTLVQSRVTQIALQHFWKRSDEVKSLLVNITAICSYENFWFGQQSHISLPYLSVYESANAFGFYHSNSIQKEYAEKVDVLNILPGAVITKNTRSGLRTTPLSVDDKTFVRNIMRVMGNCTGPQYADWRHELAAVLPNFLPRSVFDAVLGDTATKLRDEFLVTYTRSHESHQK